MADEKEKAKAEEIDLSDLSLVGTEVEIDENADAFAPPPPPPEFDKDGKKIKYLAKLSLNEDFKPSKAKSKQGVEYVTVPTDVVIIDEGGKYDGRKITDRVTTLVGESGTSRMAGVLRACGVKVPARIDIFSLARLFRDTIANEPQVQVELTWGAYSQEKEKTVLRGMKRWPKKDDGTYSGQAEFEGEPVTARADVSRYEAI